MLQRRYSLNCVSTNRFLKICLFSLFTVKTTSLSTNIHRDLIGTMKITRKCGQKIKNDKDTVVCPHCFPCFLFFRKTVVEQHEPIIFILGGIVPVLFGFKQYGSRMKVLRFFHHVSSRCSLYVLPRGTKIPRAQDVNSDNNPLESVLSECWSLAIFSHSDQL